MEFLHIGPVFLRLPKFFIWKRKKIPPPKKKSFNKEREREKRFIIISAGRPKPLSREMCLEKISRYEMNHS